VVARDDMFAGQIRQKAFEIGFTHCGFAEAVALETEEAGLRDWLAAGHHAGMQWMARDPHRRVDPREVLEGACTVISLAMNYYSPERHADERDRARISRYAWGDDYHLIIERRLEELERFVVGLLPGVRTRRYVDTGPVMDKAWAVRAGYGWLGKHGNVITRDYGSWIFLGEILTTLELTPGVAMEDFCGTCTSCLDACPTQAIVEPYVVDAGKCISYVTIEHRGPHPESVVEMDFQNWVFGCDICQDVCPWNSFAQPTGEAGFAPRPFNLAPGIVELTRLSDDEFRSRYRNSPLKRAKPEGLRRNARTLLAQQESHRD
jgi:epoxyqueuosine reductase